MNKHSIHSSLLRRPGFFFFFFCTHLTFGTYIILGPKAELVLNVLHLRFQVVMWVFSQFRVSCSPTSTNQIYILNSCYTSESMNGEASIKPGCSEYLGYGYGKCMFVDFWIEYICPPNCAHY
jgi:hypothetical protein